MNSLCTGCSAPPTKFCLCQGMAFMLCNECISKHENGHPLEIHDLNPFLYFPVLEGLGVQGFRMRKMAIANGAETVRRLEDAEMKQYQEARRGVEETVKRYMDWLDYLHTSFLRLIQQFHSEKVALMTSLECPLSNLSNLVYGWSDLNRVEELRFVETSPLLAFQQEVEAMQQRFYACCGPQGDFEAYFLSLFRIDNAPKSEIQRPYIPLVRKNILQKWDILSGKVEKMTLSQAVDITYKSASVLLLNGDLFSCVGESRQTLQINGMSGAVTILDSMGKGRNAPGIVCTENSIYVFGGWQSRETFLSGEKFSLHTSKWTPLQHEMETRHHQFNPTIHEQTVYLAGGFESTAIETFSILEEHFYTLPITLPDKTATLCLIHNGELVTLQQSTLTIWDCQSGKARETKNIGLGVKESSMSPLLVGSKLYFTNESDFKSKIFSLDLSDMSVLQINELKHSLHD